MAEGALERTKPRSSKNRLSPLTYGKVCQQQRGHPLPAPQVSQEAQGAKGREGRSRLRAV